MIPKARRSTPPITRPKIEVLNNVVIINFSLLSQSVVQFLLILRSQLQNHLLHSLDCIFLCIHNPADVNEKEKAHNQQAVDTVNNSTINEDSAELFCLQSVLQSSEEKSAIGGHKSNKCRDPEQVYLDGGRNEVVVAKGSQSPLILLDFPERA